MSLSRLIGGFFLAILFAISVALLDIEERWFSGELEYVPISLAFFSLLIVIFLWSGGSRIHGSWPSDSWISRESEVEMRRRLESEIGEASLQDIGTKWARMEMEHLESKHSEE